MMRWYGSGMGPVGWLAMGLFWLILLGLIVWLVSRLLPGSAGATTRSSGESSLGGHRVSRWAARQAARAALVAAQRDTR
jgi:hypothetical protein